MAGPKSSFNSRLRNIVLAKLATASSTTPEPFHLAIPSEVLRSQELHARRGNLPENFLLTPILLYGALFASSSGEDPDKLSPDRQGGGC